MAEIVSDYDPAEDLTSPEALSVFVNEALKTEDADYIAHALGVCARASGMAGIAEVTTLSSEGNPTLKTTLAVMKALGISLTADVSATPAPT
ncbi:MAG: addiction module antidote protein [Rhizobium sp.]|uniref:addiction module antidote protein n=1 Tax=Rhizobium sp. R86522 TaxID=3093861 RepID=UPI002ADB33F1|nr:addiction module antidote protein [Rhizobium sp.]